MKTTGARSGIIYFVLALLIGGMIWLVSNIVMNGNKFITMPYNGHIYDDDTPVQSGDVLDRNNLALVYDENGRRVYSDDEDIRKALLHTTGDYSGYIGTSIQSRLKAQLVGYNFITGLNDLPENPYMSGRDIKLTVDADLSKLAYQLLDGKNGAVLLSNYKTGEILVKVSAPTYDPMNIPEDLQENSIYSGVFVDNTISSSYTPGSIFKLVTAVSAIENLSDYQNVTCNCTGSLAVGDSRVTCLGKHGNIGMQEALGNSCNVYFAKIALEIGEDKLQQTAESLGFNKSFSLPDFTTKESNISLENSEDIELAWAGVGQFTTTVNPANMLMLMHAVANSGNAVPLRLTESGFFDEIANQEVQLLSAETANNLKILMRAVVRDYYGDASFSNMNICAKTGTAEVGENKNPNAWIVGFSENEETPYAFSIVVEDAESGMSVAGNIVKKLLAELSKK